MVAFGRYHGNLTGQVFTIVILTVAACEASIALALVVILYNRRSSLDVTLWQDIREEGVPATSPSQEESRGRADRAGSRARVVSHPDSRGHRAGPPGAAVAGAADKRSRSGDVSGFFVQNVWMIPCLPLLGALIAALGARRLRSSSHVPVIAGIALAFLVSLWRASSRRTPRRPRWRRRWLSISNLEVPIEFRVDGLTTMMLSMVTFVSSLVAIFAVGYMAGDPGYPRFFALIGLFVFSMTGLVLSNNYLLTYVFWEGVGVCSYLLIGYWHTRPAAATAALKAFLVNRIGDFGFAIAIFWLWAVVPGHDLSYGNILNESALAALPEAAKVGHPAACSSGPPRPRVRRFRSTSGCPTRWKVRRRSRP